MLETAHAAHLEKTAKVHEIVSRGMASSGRPLATSPRIFALQHGRNALDAAIGC